MAKPKTVKAFLRMCIQLAETNRDELRGHDLLSEEEYRKLGYIRTGIQNELGDSAKLIDKFDLKYNSK